MVLYPIVATQECAADIPLKGGEGSPLAVLHILPSHLIMVAIQRPV
jgi:hypothetical protein